MALEEYCTLSDMPWAKCSWENHMQSGSCIKRTRSPRIEYKPWDSFESDYLSFLEDDHYEGKTQDHPYLQQAQTSCLG